MKICITALLSTILTLLSACNSQTIQPLKTVKHIEIEKFMGLWYVHAFVPTPLDRNAVSPTEHYSLNPNGTITTTYSYRNGKVDGKLKQSVSQGKIINQETNASWEMQVMKIFTSDFQIAFIDIDYQETIVGRNKRDYLWVMSRKPTISPDNLEQLLSRAQALGYDRDKIKITTHSTN